MPTPSRKQARKGGLRGGPARAKKLSPERRAAIARAAAAARWKPQLLVLEQPRDLDELRGFVAHYGGYARVVDGVDVAAVLLRAVAACRDDACLARMLPVFIHRAHEHLFDSAALRSARGKTACALGYFVELTCRLGDLDPPLALLRDLRRARRSVAPFALFHAELALPRDSARARAWKLVLGESEDSFASYFAKAFRAEPPVFRRMPHLARSASVRRAFAESTKRYAAYAAS